MKIAALNDKIISTFHPPIVPKFIEKFKKIGFEICIQKEDSIFLMNANSKEFNVFNSREELIKNSNVLLSFSGILEDDLKYINDSHILIGDYHPVKFQKLINKVKEIGAKIFSLRMLPRITRAQPFDILSSQNNLAGYVAVLIASEISQKIFPLLITSAGTIYPAKILVIGVGVAGMQAIATAKRLGAIVHAFDVRKEAKNDAISVGAEFIEISENFNFEEINLKKNNFEKNNFDANFSKKNISKKNIEDINEKFLKNNINDQNNNAYKNDVYSKELPNEKIIKIENTLLNVINKFDIVITTAQLHLKKAPIIITKKILDNMKNNSVIVDLSGEFGGNCELTEHGKLINYKNKLGNNIKIFSPEEILSMVPIERAEFFSCNIFNFINTFFKIKTEKNENNDSSIKCITYDDDDEIIKSVLLNKTLEKILTKD